MNEEQIAAAIALLETVRLRPAMFVGWNDLNRIQSFLTGFELPLTTLDIQLPIREATQQRGWEWTARGGFDFMERQGLTDEQQSVEAIEIYLYALRSLRPTATTE
jgi:hypothetical protein